MSKTRSDDLERQIEALVREHVATLRRKAEAAVLRAFSQTAAPMPRSRGQTMGPAPAACATGRAPRPCGAPPLPRVLSATAERLYAAVCAHPGEGMSTLAAALGMTARQLKRPMRQLRQAGRIRSVGQRQATRYFPRAQRATEGPTQAAGEAANSDG